MTRDFSIFIDFIKIYIKSRLEYKVSFFSELFSNICYCFVLYIGITSFLVRFKFLNNWSYYDLVFLISLNLLSAGLSGLFFWGPANSISQVIQSGDFDKYLTKPINPFLLLILNHFSHTFVAWILVSGIFLAISLVNIPMTWSIFKLFWFFMLICGAVLIDSSVLIVIGTVSFWTIKNEAIFQIAWDDDLRSIRAFAYYPLTIFEKWINFILCFVIPFAFISYFPAMYILEKPDYFFHPIFKYCTPLVGFSAFHFAIKFFNYGIKHYKSTGS